VPRHSGRWSRPVPGARAGTASWPLGRSCELPLLARHPVHSRKEPAAILCRFEFRIPTDGRDAENP
jgi:hypothetical protein